MKRYLKYIFLSLVSTVLAVSCLEELEPTPSLVANDEVAVLVPRVKSFTNQYVTKVGYSEDENHINNLKVLIFNSNGALVHSQDMNAGTRSLTLNKSMLNSSANGDLTKATVVMLANMDLAALKVKNNTTWESINLQSLTLDILKNASYHIPEVESVLTSVPSDGFPMIGGASEVNLSSTSSTNQQTPVVVDLKILYAKVNFEISVEPDGDNQRVDPSNTQQMQFQLSGYSIYNVSKVTSLDIPDNAGEPVRDIFGNVPDEDDIADFDESTASSEYAYPATGNGAKVTLSKTATLSGPSIPFTFYMAESRFNRSEDNAREDLIGIYPEDWLTPAEDEDVKGWTDLSAAQKKLPQNKLNGVKYGYDHLIQQFKPKIVEQASSPSPGAGLATYVLLTGTYKDYRGTNWNVNYKVYLGKDNAQNFHVDRNSEYTNYITIKGIRNRQEGSYGVGEVWIDHRVNVSLGSGQGPDNCVTITRETLLDAHIEVRPLRVQWSGTTYDRVNIYLPTDPETNQLMNWVGIEKFTKDNCQDGATYCFVTDPVTKEKTSIGKRKYFTTGLINELQTMGGDLGVKTDEDGRKFLDFYNGHCAWIYFDENTSSTSRDAVIRLEFYKNDRMTAAEEYTIRQNGLQTIEGTNYIVESYEEYLHSYDSEDKYNLSTSPVDYTQQGLAWGKVEKLSTDIIVAAAPIPGLRGERYDYFHQGDVPPGDNYYTYTKNSSGNWDLTPDATDNFSTGLYFTNRAATKKLMTVRDMASVPDNAYEYCLSKNKYNETDNTLDIHWYLPDVYELKAVLAASQSDGNAADFGSDSYYWSSQPSFSGQLIQNLSWIDEVEEIARAVSSESGGTVKDISRILQNRIRCFYSADGIRGVDMNNRVPDGLGGNYTFLMQGKPDNGYFHNLVAAAGTEDTPETVIEDFDDTEWYDYPTRENSLGVAGAEFEYTEFRDNGNLITGFEVNPQENWSEYILDLDTFGEYPTEHYTTLATYPGLVRETLQKFGRDVLNVTIYIPFVGNRTLLHIAESLGINVDNWFLIEAYKPIEGTVKSQTQKMESSSIKDMTQIPLPEELNPLNDKLKISLGTANSNGNKPDFEYYEVVSKNTTPYTREWVPPIYYSKTYTVTPQETTVEQDGEGVKNGVSTRGILSSATLEKAKQAAFNDETNLLGQVTSKGAYTLAKENASTNLINHIKSEYGGWSYDEDDIHHDPSSLNWNTDSPAIQYETITNTSSRKEVKCTVTLTAIVKITKGDKTLFLQESGTGQWGEPVKGETERVSQKAEIDELRVYSGNSLTITCADPAYEITKVRVYFSGSNKIGNETYSPLYYARFVDVDIPADDPILGDETSHLVGMEYSDDDKWQQWSGIGKQTITLNLVDYVVTSDFNLGGILSGEWFTYDYEYRAASRNLDYYLIVDRIDVKCTEIKEPEEESTE